jgi:hypothetical protein
MRWVLEAIDTGKVLRTFGYVITVTVAVTLLLLSYRGLPARVINLEGRVDVMEPMVAELRAYADAVDPRLKGMEALQNDVTEIKCILKAQVEGSNAARCLGTYR